MSLVTDNLKHTMMNLRLSVLACRVVCGGIPVMYMFSEVDFDGHTVRTYGAEGIFLVQKTVHLTSHFGKGLFSKNLHDRQKKQCKFH